MSWSSVLVHGSFFGHLLVNMTVLIAVVFNEA